MAHKVSIDNLADVRSELRYTQDEMAEAMRIVRQSVASMEKGHQFDYRFVNTAIENLKRNTTEKLASIELVETGGDREKLHVAFTSKRVAGGRVALEAAESSWPSNGIEVDSEKYLIMLMTNRIDTALAANDSDYIVTYDPELKNLRDKLRHALGE